LLFDSIVGLVLNFYWQPAATRRYTQTK